MLKDKIKSIFISTLEQKQRQHETFFDIFRLEKKRTTKQTPFCFQFQLAGVGDTVVIVGELSYSFLPFT